MNFIHSLKRVLKSQPSYSSTLYFSLSLLAAKMWHPFCKYALHKNDCAHNGTNFKQQFTSNWLWVFSSCLHFSFSFSNKICKLYMECYYCFSRSPLHFLLLICGAIRSYENSILVILRFQKYFPFFCAFALFRPLIELILSLFHW